MTLTPRRWLLLFAVLLLGAAAMLGLGLLAAVRIVRDPGYPASTGDPAVALQDRAFTLRGQRCEVLIYGDSTANIGLDPSLITARTGLSACNIATNRPIVDALGELPLDAFLAHNPAPRLLVLQFEPDIFYRAKSGWEHNGPYSPLVILSRDVPAPEALRAMLMHPGESTQFLLHILGLWMFPRAGDRVRIDAHYRYALAHAEQTGGQLDLELPALDRCSAPVPTLYGALDREWVAGLRRRYEARGIAVVVRASPVPGCDPYVERYRRELSGTVDGTVESLPVHDFVAGDRHTTPEGTRAETEGLIELMRKRDPQLLHGRP